MGRWSPLWSQVTLVVGVAVRRGGSEGGGSEGGVEGVRVDLRE